MAGTESQAIVASSTVAETAATTNSRMSQITNLILIAPSGQPRQPARLPGSRQDGQGACRAMPWTCRRSRHAWVLRGPASSSASPTARPCCRSDCAIELPAQQRQPGVQQAQLQVFSQEERLLGADQHGFWLIDPGHADQTPGRRPGLARPACRRCFHRWAQLLPRLLGRRSGRPACWLWRWGAEAAGRRAGIGSRAKSALAIKGIRRRGGWLVQADQHRREIDLGHGPAPWSCHGAAKLLEAWFRWRGSLPSGRPGPDRLRAAHQRRLLLRHRAAEASMSTSRFSSRERDSDAQLVQLPAAGSSSATRLSSRASLPAWSLTTSCEVAKVLALLGQILAVLLPFDDGLLDQLCTLRGLPGHAQADRAHAQEAGACSPRQGAGRRRGRCHPPATG